MSLEKILKLPKGSLYNSEDFKEIASLIELNPIATEKMIASLKQVPKDESPIDLIFAVKYEDSLNNRKYTTKAYRSIVQQIISSDVFIPVHFGHQDPAKESFEARMIVGSVIGAHLDEKNGIIYYRIIPDASPNCADIRRWLRNKQINAISIWGYSYSVNVENGIEIIDDFVLLSVDLVPPLTEGQQNVGLAIGERAKSLFKRELENQKENNKKMGNSKIESSKIRYNKGVYDMSNNVSGLQEISNAGLAGEMAYRLREGMMPLKMVLGEMEGLGVASEDELNLKAFQVQELQKEANELLEKIKKAGFKDFEELLNFAIEAKKENKEKQQKEEFQKLKNTLMEHYGLCKDGKATGAMAGFVEKWAGLEIGMSYAEMDEKIKRVLSDEQFKKLAGESIGADVSIAGSADKLDGEPSNKEYTI